jgi:integrase
VDRFLKVLGELRHAPLTVVAREHVLQFKETRKHEVESSTFNTELVTLSVAFERASKTGLIPWNPVSLQNDQLVESSSVRSLEVWEIQGLLLATRILDWRTCIYIGFYTACQLVDAAYRRWNDLVQDEAGRTYLTLPANQRRDEKKVLVHPALLDHFNSLPRCNEFICPTLAKLERWTADNHFSQIVLSAKLEKGVTFRCLRHTFARLVGLPIKRLDTAGPEAPLALPDIRVPPLPCQLPGINQK